MAFDSKTAKIAGSKSSRLGVSNKTNIEIREAFQTLIQESLPKINAWLQKVGDDNPEKALLLIAKYAEFVLPKLSRSEVSMEEPEDQIKPDWNKLSVSALNEIDALYIEAKNKK